MLKKRQRREPVDWERDHPELSQTWPFDWAIEMPSLGRPEWQENMRLVEAS